MPKSFRNLGTYISFYLIISILCSCSGTKVVPGANGNNSADGTGKVALAGTWIGKFNSKTTSDDSLRDKTVKLSLEPVDASSGTFRFDLPQMDNVYVRGSYNDLSHSLLFSIKDSTLSTIGLAGATTELNYDLIGHVLVLDNERINLKLVRDAADGSSDSSGGNSLNPTSDPLLGRWRCRDSSHLVWQLNLKSDTAFALDVFDPSGAGRRVWMTGGSEVSRSENSASALLTVQSSDPALYVGMNLQANLVGDGLLNLRLVTDGGEAMACTR